MGLETALAKIAEIGIDTGDVRVEYTDLSDDSMSAKAFD